MYVNKKCVWLSSLQTQTVYYLRLNRNAQGAHTTMTVCVAAKKPCHRWKLPYPCLAIALVPHTMASKDTSRCGSASCRCTLFWYQATKCPVMHLHGVCELRVMGGVGKRGYGGNSLRNNITVAVSQQFETQHHSYMFPTV